MRTIQGSRECMHHSRLFMTSVNIMDAETQSSDAVSTKFSKNNVQYPVRHVREHALKHHKTSLLSTEKQMREISGDASLKKSSPLSSSFLDDSSSKTSSMHHSVISQGADSNEFEIGCQAIHGVIDPHHH